MSQVAFSVRMDKNLKNEFSTFCENVGMNMSTAFVIFAKAAVRERRFPFEIKEYPKYSKALDIYKETIAENAATLDHDWTLDEINAEIAAARRERRSRMQLVTA